MENQDESESTQDEGWPGGFLAELACDIVRALLAETLEGLILALVFLFIMVFMIK